MCASMSCRSDCARAPRVWIDLICHILFLLPFAALMVYLAWPFFVSSYASGEASSNAGGLIRWPAKIWVLLGFISLLAQGVAEIIKRGAMLSGDLDMQEEKSAEDDLPPAAKNAGGRG